MQKAVNEVHNHEKYQSIMKVTELADEFITTIKN